MLLPIIIAQFKDETEKNPELARQVENALKKHFGIDFSRTTDVTLNKNKVATQIDDKTLNSRLFNAKPANRLFLIAQHHKLNLEQFRNLLHSYVLFTQQTKAAIENKLTSQVVAIPGQKVEPIKINNQQIVAEKILNNECPYTEMHMLSLFNNDYQKDALLAGQSEVFASLNLDVKDDHALHQHLKTFSKANNTSNFLALKKALKDTLFTANGIFIDNENNAFVDDEDDSFQYNIEATKVDAKKEINKLKVAIQAATDVKEKAALKAALKVAKVDAVLDRGLRKGSYLVALDDIILELLTETISHFYNLYTDNAYLSKQLNKEPIAKLVIQDTLEARRADLQEELEAKRGIIDSKLVKELTDVEAKLAAIKAERAAMEAKRIAIEVKRAAIEARKSAKVESKLPPVMQEHFKNDINAFPDLVQKVEALLTSEFAIRFLPKVAASVIPDAMKKWLSNTQDEQRHNWLKTATPLQRKEWMKDASVVQRTNWLRVANQEQRGEWPLSTTQGNAPSAQWIKQANAVLLDNKNVWRMFLLAQRHKLDLVEFYSLLLSLKEMNTTNKDPVADTFLNGIDPTTQESWFSIFADEQALINSDVYGGDGEPIFDLKIDTSNSACTIVSEKLASDIKNLITGKRVKKTIDVSEYDGTSANRREDVLQKIYINTDNYVLFHHNPSRLETRGTTLTSFKDETFNQIASFLSYFFHLNQNPQLRRLHTSKFEAAEYYTTRIQEEFDLCFEDYTPFYDFLIHKPALLNNPTVYELVSSVNKSDDFFKYLLAKVLKSECPVLVLRNLKQIDFIAFMEERAQNLDVLDLQNEVSVFIDGNSEPISDKYYDILLQKSCQTNSLSDHAIAALQTRIFQKLYLLNGSEKYALFLMDLQHTNPMLFEKGLSAYPNTSKRIYYWIKDLPQEQQRNVLRYPARPINPANIQDELQFTYWISDDYYLRLIKLSYKPVFSAMYKISPQACAKFIYDNLQGTDYFNLAIQFIFNNNLANWIDILPIPDACAFLANPNRQISDINKEINDFTLGFNHWIGDAYYLRMMKDIETDELMYLSTHLHGISPEKHTALLLQLFEQSSKLFIPMLTETESLVEPFLDWANKLDVEQGFSVMSRAAERGVTINFNDLSTDYKAIYLSLVSKHHIAHYLIERLKDNALEDEFNTYVNNYDRWVNSDYYLELIKTNDRVILDHIGTVLHEKWQSAYLNLLIDIISVNREFFIEEIQRIFATSIDEGLLQWLNTFNTNQVDRALETLEQNGCVIDYNHLSLFGNSKVQQATRVKENNKGPELIAPPRPKSPEPETIIEVEAAKKVFKVTAPITANTQFNNEIEKSLGIHREASPELISWLARHQTIFSKAPLSWFVDRVDYAALTIAMRSTETTYQEKINALSNLPGFDLQGFAKWLVRDNRPLRTLNNNFRTYQGEINTFAQMINKPGNQHLFETLLIEPQYRKHFTKSIIKQMQAMLPQHRVFEIMAQHWTKEEFAKLGLELAFKDIPQYFTKEEFDLYGIPNVSFDELLQYATMETHLKRAKTISELAKLGIKVSERDMDDHRALKRKFDDKDSGIALDFETIQAAFWVTEDSDLIKANEARLKFQNLDQLIPQGYVAPGREASELRIMTPENLYQIETGDIRVGEEILERLKTDQDPIQYLLIPNTEHIVWDPLLISDDAEKLSEYEPTKSKLQLIVNSYEPTADEKPVIMHGSVNVNKIHHVPFFIYKNADQKVHVRTVDPSSPASDSESSALLLGRIFDDLFPGCDYQDLQAAQQLGERDCGFICLQTQKDAIRKGLFTVVDGQLVSEPEQLSINGSKQRIVHYKRENGVTTAYYAYPRTLNKQGLNIRQDWISAMSAETTQPFHEVDANEWSFAQLNMGIVRALIKPFYYSFVENANDQAAVDARGNILGDIVAAIGAVEYSELTKEFKDLIKPIEDRFVELMQYPTEEDAQALITFFRVNYEDLQFDKDRMTTEWFNDGETSSLIQHALLKHLQNNVVDVLAQQFQVYRNNTKFEKILDPRAFVEQFLQQKHIQPLALALTPEERVMFRDNRVSDSRKFLILGYHEHLTKSIQTFIADNALSFYPLINDPVAMKKAIVNAIRGNVELANAIKLISQNGELLTQENKKGILDIINDSAQLVKVYSVDQQINLFMKTVHQYDLNDLLAVYPVTAQDILIFERAAVGQLFVRLGGFSEEQWYGPVGNQFFENHRTQLQDIINRAIVQKLNEKIAVIAQDATPDTALDLVYAPALVQSLLMDNEAAVHPAFWKQACVKEINYTPIEQKASQVMEPILEQLNVSMSHLASCKDVLQVFDVLYTQLPDEAMKYGTKNEDGSIQLTPAGVALCNFLLHKFVEMNRAFELQMMELQNALDALTAFTKTNPSSKTTQELSTIQDELASNANILATQRNHFVSHLANHILGGFNQFALGLKQRLLTSGIGNAADNRAYLALAAIYGELDKKPFEDYLFPSWKDGGQSAIAALNLDDRVLDFKDLERVESLRPIIFRMAPDVLTINPEFSPGNMGLCPGRLTKKVIMECLDYITANPKQSDTYDEIEYYLDKLYRATPGDFNAIATDKKYLRKLTDLCRINDFGDANDPEMQVKVCLAKSAQMQVLSNNYQYTDKARLNINLQNMYTLEEFVKRVSEYDFAADHNLTNRKDLMIHQCAAHPTVFHKILEQLVREKSNLPADSTHLDRVDLTRMQTLLLAARQESWAANKLQTQAKYTQANSPKTVQTILASTGNRVTYASLYELSVFWEANNSWFTTLRKGRFINGFFTGNSKPRVMQEIDLILARYEKNITKGEFPYQPNDVISEADQQALKAIQGLHHNRGRSVSARSAQIITSITQCFPQVEVDDEASVENTVERFVEKNYEGMAELYDCYHQQEMDLYPIFNNPEYRNNWVAGQLNSLRGSTLFFNAVTGELGENVTEADIEDIINDNMGVRNTFK